MRRFVLAFLAALLMLLGSAARSAGSDISFVPGVGTVLQSVQPASVPQPASSETGLSLESKANAPLPLTAPFRVTTIQITGNTVFSAEFLHHLVKDAEGKDLTLEQVGAFAERITNYYRSHNYPLARAIIPAQTIRDGTVTIQIMEARYGKVVIDNKSSVRDALLSGTLSPLQPNDQIAQDKLDRALLLLSDIPGLSVEANLQAGQTVGTSDLILIVAPLPGVTGGTYVDNNGSRYTGKNRLGASVNISNPLRHGDVLSASVLSTGKGLSYGQLSYETLLSAMGARFGGSGSTLRYELGDSLAAIGGRGTARVFSLWAKQPLVRSQSQNVYAQLQADGLWLDDRVDTDNTSKDRRLLNTTISLNGDFRTPVPPGLTSWRLAVSTGRVSFSGGTAQLADSATAQTQGGFIKYNVWANYLQNLTAKNTLYFAVLGQAANANLDQSQKMTVGGPQSVRAYDTGALSGDSGALVTVELRHLLDMPVWGADGRSQLMVFFDSARLSINKAPWLSGINQARLSGAGIGFVWAGTKQLTAQLSLATRLGSLPALVTSSAKVHAWAVVSKEF